MTENPFRYNHPVDGDYYMEREELRKTCEGFLRNGISVLIIGPRRLGKTSFVRNLCKRWESLDYGDSVLMDVYSVSSHQDFLLQLVSAIAQKKGRLPKIMEWSRKLLPSVVKLGSEVVGGAISFQWNDSQAEQEKKLCIQQTLSSLTQLQSQTCLVIDECQQLSKENLDDSGWLEATIRQNMQDQVGKVAYLLTGSRRDMIHAMTNDSARPLYRACQLIEFPPFGEEFTDWVMSRFTLVGVTCNREAITHLRRQVKDSPNYVQMVCYHIVAMGYRAVDIQTVDAVLTHVVPQNAYSYETLLYNLTPTQQRVLRMVAVEEGGYHTEALMRRYEIKTPQHVAQALSSLKKRNILDQEADGRGKVSFDDPLFRLWLRYKFGNQLPGGNVQPTLFS